MSKQFPKRVAVIATYCTEAEPQAVARMTLVMTDTTVTKGYKIVASREWWVKDMDMDDIHDELDFLIGSIDVPGTVVFHVDGMQPLQQDRHGHYLSNLVTRADLIRLMGEQPEKFA